MKNKISGFILAFVLVLGLVVACAPKPAPVAPVEPVKPMAISIVTGGVGGIFYPYGGGIAEIINKNIPGLRATAEATAASIVNVRLLRDGKAQIGLIAGDVLWEAYGGTGRFKGEKIGELRALFRMYPEFFYIVTLKEYPIYKVGDLKGKSVSVGAPGSAVVVMSENVFSTLGISFADFSVKYLSFAENVTALRDKTIHVGIWQAGVPVASVIDIATTHDVRFIPLTDEEVKKVTAAFPYYGPAKIPAGVYRGVDTETLTVAVFAAVVVRADFPEKFAYEITKQVFANIDFLRKVHKAAELTTLDAGPLVPIALHPGAEKFYKEKGVIK